MKAQEANPLQGIRQEALPLTGNAADYDRIVDAAGNATVVLMGEASHGTHEFYEARALVTRRLIEERGFNGVIIEGDWPDADRVNRYVQIQGGDSSAAQALSSFTRFPEWMWRNTVVRDFAAWLRERNERVPENQRAGFYGMDVYSLFRSQQEVIRYLQAADPEAAARALARYSCFDGYNGEAETYAYAMWNRSAASCEAQAVDQFREIEGRAGAENGVNDELFSALQNARVVMNGEQYYRTMFSGTVSGWNLRDRHMADTIEALLRHLARRTSLPKVIVWAHNSHVGDARATEMGAAGEWNVGQLMRESHGAESFLIGFTTYTGTVMAASAWGEPGVVMTVRPGLPGSYESLFHESGVSDFLLMLGGRNAGAVDLLRSNLLERAIGVVYAPQTERASHYFNARLADQFDSVIHFDRTRALEPIPIAGPIITDSPVSTGPSTRVPAGRSRR